VSKNTTIRWPETVAAVRETLWEHGTGEEMFVENDRLWSVMRDASIRLVGLERYVESVARAQPDEKLLKTTIGELRKIQPNADAPSNNYWRPLADEMGRKIEEHGDKRFQCGKDAAVDFTRDSYERVEKVIAAGGDWIRRIAESFGIPPESITDEMTVEDISELAAYMRQLVVFSKHLRPYRKLTVHDVPWQSLPSYVLQRKLEAHQRRAPRVSGSDAGDRQIAPLTLYADFVDVDKRTGEFLRQVRAADRDLDGLMGTFGRASPYGDLLSLN